MAKTWPVWILIVLASGGRACGDTDGQRYLKALVDVFNGLYIDNSLYFYANFGKGNILLYGNAQVKVGSPICLVSTRIVEVDNSTLSYDARMSIDFEILIPPSGLWWTLTGCSVELKYEITRNSSKGIGVPVSLSVDSCDLIQYGPGQVPDHPDQILPVLAQGLFSVAKEHLSFEADWTTSVDGVLRSQVIGQLMEYAVSRMAPPWY